jgi:hypothetical protein
MLNPPYPNAGTERRMNYSITQPPVTCNPQSIGIVSQRVMARLILQRAFVRALEFDPTLAVSPLFTEHAKANADALLSEYGA